MKYFLLTIIFILIATVTFAAQVNLAWEPSPTTSVKGYELRYSQDPATLTTGVDAYVVDVGNVLEYGVDGLGLGTWYFAVLAYNDTNKSDLSNTVEFNEPGVVIIENLHVKEEKPASVQLNLFFGTQQ